LPFGQAFAEVRPRAVMPCCLDKQPAGVCGPGLRDRPKPPLLTGRRLARDEPEVAHQLLRPAEPGEVADLGAEPDRC
jgi:hypothetical protein